MNRHAEQLSLFFEEAEVAPIDNVVPGSINDRDKRNDATGIQNRGALETLSPKHGEELGASKPTSESDLRGSGADDEPDLRIGGRAEDGISAGVGDRDEGVGVPSGRDRTTTVVVRSGKPQSAPTLARDFRITDVHGVSIGGPKEKVGANLTAIRTLKNIEAARREATADEQAVLVKYSGWGAFPSVFEANPPREWRGVAGELRGLLSPEEYGAARASTPNAHYTSPEVIAAVWQAMTQFGLKAGTHVLEPSAGIGHFFGLMPENMYAGTRRTGVELDSITARIAAKLYPDSNIQEKAFESTQLPKNFFDAAVGNIPFGNYPVFDPEYRKKPHLTRVIHDYFLTKSLDVVRPGGVIALITSRFTMDKQDGSVRKHLAESAVLLGAIRLPSGTFKANAGTDVTTDILFLQKRQAPQVQQEQPWTELGTMETQDGPVQLNEYFIRHPEMMLGRMSIERGQYGTPTAFLAGNFDRAALAEAISRLPTEVYVERGPQVGSPRKQHRVFPILFVNEIVLFVAFHYLASGRSALGLFSGNLSLLDANRSASAQRPSAVRISTVRRGFFACMKCLSAVCAEHLRNPYYQVSRAE